MTNDPIDNTLVVVFGVSGCGKSTIARRVSERTGLPYFDADSYHPQSNIDKMSKGLALDDDDRKAWLDTLSRKLEEWGREGGAVLACSALKEKYRKKLAERAENIHWVYLKGSFEIIEQRIDDRSGHFMSSDLLLSQFQALEEPGYGMVMDIQKTPEAITEEIISNLKMKKSSEFGVYGLGVMGRSMALNIADKGFQLSVYNRAEGGEEEVVPKFMKENESYSNIEGFTDLGRFVDSLARPRKILIMIKAGPVVDLVMEQLLPLLSEGDVLIDGGNSHFSDTERREGRARSLGIGFVGAGVSGGEEGARKGPSIMPGGKARSYAEVAQVLEAIAARDRFGNPCCQHIGPGGSGHFIKMVHNGIEYVEMQLLAELYGLLRTEWDNEQIADLFEEWNSGDLESYLLGITVDILRKKEGDHYVLDKILDKAGNKGTGSWSSQEALQLGMPNSMMVSAVFARYLSSFQERRVELSKHIPIGQDSTAGLPDREILKGAYAFSRMINHYQGFLLMAEASTEFEWNLDFEVIARVWSNGCIIKSALMNRFGNDFSRNRDLLALPEVVGELSNQEPDLVQLLESGLQKRVSLSCFGSGYNFWVDMTTASLPANLIQAQRDFFGAHTYQRNDDPSGKFYHTDWK